MGCLHRESDRKADNAVQNVYYAPFMVGSDTYYFMVQYTLTGSAEAQADSSMRLHAADTVRSGDTSQSTFDYEGKTYDEMGVYTASIANGEDNLYTAFHHLGKASAVATPVAGIFRSYLKSELKGIQKSMRSQRADIDQMVGGSAEAVEAEADLAYTAENAAMFDTALSCASGAMIGLGLLGVAVLVFDDFVLHIRPTLRCSAAAASIHHGDTEAFCPPAWSERHISVCRIGASSWPGHDCASVT